MMANDSWIRSAGSAPLEFLRLIHQGWRFVGIEMERHYFDVACRRIDDAHRQADCLQSRRWR